MIRFSQRPPHRYLTLLGAALLSAALPCATPLCAAPLSAQPPQKAPAAAPAALTWDNVLAQARVHNPALKKADQGLQQAQQYYKRSFTGFLPQLSASGSINQSGGEDLTTSKDYSYGLSASISLFSGFSDVSEVKYREAGLQLQRAQQQRSISDTLYALRRDYITLLWAQQTVNLAEQIMKKRTENLELVRYKYDAGREDKGSLMRVEADRNAAEYDYEKAKRNLITASYQLLSDMGSDDFRVIAVSGDLALPELPKDVNIAKLYTAVPEYRVAVNSLTQSLAQVTSAKSSLYPSLSLSGSTAQSGAQWNGASNGWRAGLSISYPFFQGGRNLYDIRIAQLNREIAEESLRQTSQGLAASLASAYNALVDAAGNVGVNEQYYQASSEQSRITTVKYINGLESYYNWYNVENDVINAQKALLNSRRDALLQAANWHKVLGE